MCIIFLLFVYDSFILVRRWRRVFVNATCESDVHGDRNFSRETDRRDSPRRGRLNPFFSLCEENAAGNHCCYANRPTNCSSNNRRATKEIRLKCLYINRATRRTSRGSSPLGSLNWSRSVVSAFRAGTRRRFLLQRGIRSSALYLRYFYCNFYRHFDGNKIRTNRRTSPPLRSNETFPEVGLINASRFNRIRSYELCFNRCYHRRYLSITHV